MIDPWRYNVTSKAVKAGVEFGENPSSFDALLYGRQKKVCC